MGDKKLIKNSDEQHKEFVRQITAAFNDFETKMDNIADSFSTEYRLPMEDIHKVGNTKRSESEAEVAVLKLRKSTFHHFISYFDPHTSNNFTNDYLDMKLIPAINQQYNIFQENIVGICKQHDMPAPTFIKTDNKSAGFHISEDFKFHINKIDLLNFNMDKFLLLENAVVHRTHEAIQEKGLAGNERESLRYGGYFSVETWQEGFCKTALYCKHQLEHSDFWKSYFKNFTEKVRKTISEQIF